jgi:excinuclease ABC subunit C
MSVTEKWRETVALIPPRPGVYIFSDKGGTILYVGKAKDLGKRVASYFSGAQTGKTSAMLRKAENLRHIVTDSESDALLLENNLIKEHQPRYNILLKDDKTFPWICIKNEPFPRIFSTRNVYRDGSVYFGPYTSGLMVKTLLTLIRQIFQVRTCSLALSESNIAAGKFKVCLEYHIGNCKAPCINLQSAGEYENTVSQIKNILKGDISGVTDYLAAIMNSFAADLKFEEAQKIKEKIELLSKYRSKSTIVNPVIKDVDVFGFTSDGDEAWVTFLKVSHGAIIQTFALEVHSRLDEAHEELLASAIAETRARTGSDSPEIVVPFSPAFRIGGVTYTVPEIGDKKKLLDLALRNAVYYKLGQKKKRAEKNADSRSARNLEKVMKDLHLPAQPVHIECFDNSNIMGTSPVAACVVFRNGRPAKSEYRHFNIKTVEGPDDFSSMEEVVKRRYSRMLEEKGELPQLIVIDGGKGQLSSAVKSLDELGIRNKVTVIGIAKKLEEIYYPGDSVPIYIDKNSYTLKLIQQLRNEAHRFGINFHRDKRSASMLKSGLDSIPGIGPVAKEKLLKKYSSLSEIKNAGRADLENLLGKAKTEKLLIFLSE